MADGLLSGLLGGGNTTNLGGIDLNQLVRPPDPLGAALAEMSQRFATAGQASRLPVSTLGAIGSALGGAGAAAQTQQTQYLDQAIKLQALKRSLQQMGYDQTTMDYLMKKWAAQQAGGGAAPGAPAVPQVAPVAPTTAAPGPPAAAPAATPAAPAAAGPYGSDAYYGEPSVQPPPATGPAQLTGGPPTPAERAAWIQSRVNGGQQTIEDWVAQQRAAAPLKTAGLLGDGSTADASGLDTLISPQGGAGAATMPASFRLASLVGPAGDGVGSGSGADPLSLIAKYESGGRNIRQQAVPESVSSASGPWQMLDSTFHEAAKKAGIDVSKYDSAKDAPIETQRAVAQALYDEKRFAPWANYNPKLAAAIGSGTPAGGTASPVSTLRGLLAGSDGGSADPLAGLLALARGSSGDKGGGDEDPLAGLLKPQDEVIPSGGGLPAGMLQKAALGGGSAGYPIPNILPPGGNAAFPALATTGDNQIPIEGPGAPTKPTSFPAEGPNAFTDPTIMQAAAGNFAGGGGNLPIIKAQYAPGSGGGGAPATGAAGAPAVGQGGFPALVGPGSGQIPGLGMTPQEVAILNAMSSLAGHANPPLKEFLDLYYKSPEYLRGAAQATQEGQTAVTGPAQIAIDQAKAANDIRVGMAKDGVMIDPGGSGKVVPIPGYGPAMAYNKDQLEAVTNKWQTQIEETKAKFDTVTVPILQKDGTLADTPMSRYDRDQKQQMQGSRAPQPGDIVGKPSAALSPGYEYRMGSDGTVTAQPIANTPEAAAAQELARSKAIADRQLQVARDSVVNAADRAEYLAKTYPNTTTGIVGSKLTGVWQPSQDMQAAIQTIEARTTLDQLKEARAASSTGASGFGQLSDVEGAKLQASIANLKQSQSQEQFLANLAIVKQNYIDAVHGPGAYKQMSDAAVLKTQPPTKEWKENDIVNYSDGSQRQLKNNEWVVVKPPTQR